VQAITLPEVIEKLRPDGRLRLAQRMLFPMVTHQVRNRRSHMIVVYLLIAMLGAAAAFFALQNPTPIAVNFFHWRSAELPLSLLMLFSALAGVLLAVLSSVAEHLRLSSRIRHLERELARERRLVEYLETPPSASRRRIGEAPEPMPEHARI
jgi:uncharacterized integral membrane protein